MAKTAASPERRGTASIDVLIAGNALALLRLAAYRGLSGIVMAPPLAMLVVLATDPAQVPAAFNDLSWNASPAS